MSECWLVISFLSNLRHEIKKLIYVISTTEYCRLMEDLATQWNVKREFCGNGIIMIKCSHMASALLQRRGFDAQELSLIDAILKEIS